MERIAQNRSATLSHTFYVDGVPTNPSPDAATVQITRADGTVLVAETAATEAGTGVVTYTLTPAQTALLDTLTVTWQATFGGQEQTYVDTVEVAGGFLFTVDQLLALKPPAQTWTTAQITDTRTLVETAIERACSRAFAPRYALETLSGTGTSDLMLTWPDLRAVRSVTVTTGGVGVDYTAGELALLAVNPSGRLYSNGNVWPYGAGNITVGYEHGMSYVPPEVTRAALILAKNWLGNQNRPIDDRAVTFNATEGGTYSLAVPGRNGSHFGHPDVDSVVDRYSMAVGVA